MTKKTHINREDFQGSKFPDLMVLYPDEFEQLYDVATYMEVEANVPVIEEGQKGESLYLVKSGQLRVYKRHDDNLYEVGSITPGDIFGEASVLYHSTAGAEVRAIDHCEFYLIPMDTAHEVFESNERFLRSITQLAERRAAASALAVNPIFSTLPMAVREVALFNAKFINIKKGDMIIKEGDEATYMFIMLAGKVEVTLQHPADKDQQIKIAVRGSGDELGEIAVVTGYPHGATVTALTSVRVLAIHNLAISAWSGRYSDFAYSLYGQVYRKLKENRQILNEILDDRDARILTINNMPPFEEFKAKHHL